MIQKLTRRQVSQARRKPSSKLKQLDFQSSAVYELQKTSYYVVLIIVQVANQSDASSVFNARIHAFNLYTHYF